MTRPGTEIMYGANLSRQPSVREAGFPSITVSCVILENTFCCYESKAPLQNNTESSLQKHSPQSSFLCLETRIVSQYSIGKKMHKTDRYRVVIPMLQWTQNERMLMMELP